MNFECDFTRGRPLPIVAVDEQLYRRLPAFLIATVDKFACLPWVGPSGVLLGGADRHDAEGFYGAAEPGVGTALEEPLPPPDLVIQDELHLISGPLGTMAGLYESAIEALCLQNAAGHTVRPKIVASTATVRRAQDMAGTDGGGAEGVQGGRWTEEQGESRGSLHDGPGILQQPAGAGRSTAYS